jgi:two-component system, NtrC family, response regulator HydG
MRRLFDQVNLVARRYRIATIEGEAGTGKSAVARALHALGAASTEPFFSCTASLLLQPGADGAEESHCEAAILERARGGTLVLDRVHELDGPQQARLLRRLIGLEQQPVRQSQAASVAARPRHILVTSEVSLRRLAAANRFRDDLCSRLVGIRLVVPPLRERREDIPLLAQFFASRFSLTFSKAVRGLGPGTIAPLLRYSWPGNVSELESVITAGALSTEGCWIRPIDLPALSALRAQSCCAAPVVGKEEDLTLNAAIQRHVARVLDATSGNKRRAAFLLGIGRSTLYRLLASAQSGGVPDLAGR